MPSFLLHHRHQLHDTAVAAVVAFERAMWHAQPQETPWIDVISG